MFNGFVNEAEKRLWIDVGTLPDRLARVVGGVVPKPATGGAVIWVVGETAELKRGL